MEEIIAKIIEIEERAREIVKDAESSKEGLEDELARETEQLRRNIAERAEKKNETLREYEDGETDKKIEQINAETERIMQSLEAKFDENKETWIEDIFDSVTK